MRLLLELILVAMLIWLGWEKPFQDRMPWHRAVQSTPATVQSTQPAPAPHRQFRPVVRTTSTPSGEWMWDPAHRGSLDRPAYNSRDASQDYEEGGRRHYWIDAKGVRHYDSATPPPATASSP